jgi:hypothetical protein
MLSTQFSRATGMYGGPRGTYGTYLVGQNVDLATFKTDRERQSGE